MGELNCKNFIALLRVLSHSGYAELLLTERKVFGCYSVDIDDDIGYHYHLIVPDKFDDSVYDETIIINHKDILSAYREGHKPAEAKRKEDKLPTKELVETVEYTGSQFIFKFYVKGIKEFETYVDLQPIDETLPIIENTAESYANLIARTDFTSVIKVVELDNTFVAEVNEINDVVIEKIEVGCVKVKVPFTKSSWLANKKFDDNYITLQATELTDVYALIHTMVVKGFTLTRWMYVHNY